MTDLSPISSEHEHLISQLPWLVNGTLEQTEAEQLKLHIAGCDVCRDEMASLYNMNRLLTTPSAGAPDTAASLERMRERIAGESKGSGFPAGFRSTIDWIGRLFEMRRAPLWAATAMCAAAVVVIMGQYNIPVDHTVDNPYQVLSSDESSGNIQLYFEIDPELEDDRKKKLLNDITQFDSVESVSVSKESGNTYKLTFEDSQSGAIVSPSVLSKLMSSIQTQPGVVDVGILP